MSTKLYVGNISSAVSENDLKAAFGKFGHVDAVTIARDSVTGLNNGIAIVAMSRDEDAIKAIGRMHLTQYAGRTIGVCRSLER